jgi:hypothetical protein
MKSEDLPLPCDCGSSMVSVIANDTPDNHAYRKGWFCFSCKRWVDAVSRERLVKTPPVV